MATLSVLSYNQTAQGGLVKMKVNNSNSNSNSNSNNNNSNSNISTATHTPTTNTTSSAMSKTFTKITVQNVLSENNGNLLNITNNLSSSSSNNTIVRKIKDFGMFGTVNASTGNASNRSASSLTSGNNVRKRPLTSAEPKEKPSANNVSKVKQVSNKKVKVIKESKKDSVKATNAAAKATLKERQMDKVCIPKLKHVIEGVKPPGTPGRKGLPLPLAVARRNARERNRVKQVNNGFAALREKIPEEVAEAFEAQGNGRGSVKKLSKVETLRMAVEYIRSLERLLGFDFPIPSDLADGGMSLLQGGSCDEDSFTLIKDEFDALSPSMDDQFDDSLSNYDMEDYFNSNAMSQSSFIEQNPNVNVQVPNQVDMLPNITTLNGLQYIRIPGTNTYQLLTPDIFIGSSNSPPNSSAEEEQFSNVIDVNCQSPSTTLETSTTADLHITSPSIMTNGTRTPATMPNIHIAECPSSSSSSSSSLSRSPVPQISSPVSSSSPNAHTITSTSTNTTTHTTTNILQHTLTHSLASAGAQIPTQADIALSPAANELLLRTCAIAASSPANPVDAIDDMSVSSRPFVTPTLPHFNLLPQSHMIKQEYVETDFVSPLTAESTSSSALMYQTTLPAMQPDDSQQRQFLLNHATSLAAVSPPLDQPNNNNNNITKCMSSSLLLPNDSPDAVGLQAFYEHEQNGNFYESVVAYKKELSDSMLETGSNCHSGNTPTLSDESMIDTIDWWEAHTPKSDGGGSVIL